MSVQKDALWCTCDGSSQKTFHLRGMADWTNGRSRFISGTRMYPWAISYVIVHRRTPAGNKEWIYNRY